MPAAIEFNPSGKMPLYQQLAQSISRQIEAQHFDLHKALPAISKVSDQYGLARETVGKAYKELVRQQYVTSVPGKGYFIKPKNEVQSRILLVFNKMSSYKKLVYEAFLREIGNSGVVDLQVHHYNPALLREIIEKNLGKYQYYVIMPHFLSSTTEAAYMDILRKIPESQLVLLDKNIPSIRNSIVVFQDFRRDIYDALNSAATLLQKYTGICLIFPEHQNHPPEVIDGVKEFCLVTHRKFALISNAASITLQEGFVYITVTEEDLVTLIKKVRLSEFYLGINLGIISFNESELKELLDITVISTDFERMGSIAAELVKSNVIRQVRNPVKLIRRGSL